MQGGLAEGRDLPRLVSLGSVFTQPLMVYCRSAEPVEMLSQLKGKRLAVGPEGSGTRVLALKLLKANEMDGPPTDAARPDAATRRPRRCVAGTIDAAFLMGDSATPQVMRSLRERARRSSSPASARPTAYLRKFRFLSKLTLPEGAMDLGKNYPPRTLQLVGPTVELVARDDLHPALSDLLIRAAREIHGGPGMFRNAGEYPAPLARDFPISADAERYYKSGEQFLYKRLPFWLASLVDRLLVRAAAAAGRDRARDAARAGALPLARPLAHLPLVRRAHGDRARDARQPQRRASGRRCTSASTRSRAPSTSCARRPRSPTSSTSCATTSPPCAAASRPRSPPAAVTASGVAGSPVTR